MTARLRDLLVWAALAASLASCSRVKPYARETHAKTSMKDRAATERKLDGHVREYREGSIGGGGAGGGGCGCN